VADFYAYLEGGPCDGTRHKLTPAEGDTGTVICKGAVYEPSNPATHHDGDVVYSYRPKVTPETSGSVPPQGIHAYNHFARSVAHTLPTSLRRSRIIQAQALRRLRVPRKLGG
jgi:hypothetical protein